MRPALIVHGPAGTGKTLWIQQEAKQRGYRLFRWNVRNDRSLREGREVLHAQVRSQEKTLIWMEGADDLTQEAQAFLRRILDTRATDVQCILEVREPWKLSAPILSRCVLKPMAATVSFRQSLKDGKAKACGLQQGQREWSIPKTWKEFSALRKAGADPVQILLKLSTDERYPKKVRIEALRRMGAGCSAWLQIAWILSLAASE